MATKTETVLLITIVAVMAVASLGFAPASEATHSSNLFVSADNSRFGNHFGGPQVIEVVVNDSDINNTDRGQGEPDITINGDDLRMVQAVDGNWYGYFADITQAGIADRTVTFPGQGLDFGTIQSFNIPQMFDEADGIAYGSTLNVLREAKDMNSFNRGQVSLPSSISWPVIQLYDFTPGNDVAVQYNKGGHAQTATLVFDTVDDYAGIMLDKVSYMRGDQVRATITDTWLNIDPTDEDSWTFSTAGDGMTHYQVYDENGTRQIQSVDNRLTRSLADLMCDDNCVMLVNANVRGTGTDVIMFQNNANSAAITDFGNRIPQPVTITEQRANSGVFVTYDDSDISTMRITSSAANGAGATVDYNDAATTVLVGSNNGGNDGDLAEAIRELRATITALTSKVASLEATITSLTARVAALEAGGGTPPPEPMTGVKGKIYTDTNSNSRLDPGERGRAGIEVITVNLADHSDVERLRTDANGDYTFELSAGGYLVQAIGGGPNSYAYITIPNNTLLTQNLAY